MKILVKVKTNAKKEEIKKIDPPSPKGFGRASETHFSIALKESPYEGRANKGLIKVLADYFGVGASRIKIIVGRKSKQKIIEIR